MITQAIVLAAGEGRRLRPITDVTPKPLVPFFGRPLLDWAIDKLVAAGVRRIAVNAYHLADQVGAHVEVTRARLAASAHTTSDYTDLYIAREPTLLGTGGAVRNLRDWLAPEPFFVLNSDAVFAAPVSLLAHAPSLLVTREPIYRSERRIVAGGTRWTALHDAESAWTFCGLTLADAELPSRLPDGPSCILRQGFLPYLDALDVQLVETDGFFADTGTPSALVDAHIRGLDYARATLDSAETTSRGTSPAPR